MSVGVPTGVWIPLGCQKRALDSLGLELQVAVGRPVRMLVLCKNRGSLPLSCLPNPAYSFDQVFEIKDKTKQQTEKLVVMVHTSNPSRWKAKAAEAA